MKEVFAFALLAFFALSAHCQKYTIEYVDKNGNAATKQNCYTYNVKPKTFQEGDSIVTFYCATKKPQMIIKVDKTGAWNGDMVSYFENGNKSLKAKFQNSILVDTLYAWYPNGTPHYAQYGGSKEDPVTKIINYWDSLATPLVLNGNGFCKCIFSSSEGYNYFYVGKVINGARDSLWTTYDLNGRVLSSEWYNKGVLGRLNNSNSGNDVSEDFNVYRSVDETAAPNGGLAAFYSFIGQNIRYPMDARRKGIEGKVFVEFVVERDGLLTKIKTIKGIGGGCDEEAERIIKLSPNWIPGKLKGVPVRQKMVLPISFKLGEYRPATNK
jgi:TonB family protein